MKQKLSKAMISKGRKKKKTERKKLIEKLDKITKELAKERDDYICQWCGKKCEKSNAHGSHVIPVSQGNRLRWDLANIKCLCFHCHMNKWHKNPIEASEWFRHKFPRRYDYLETEKLKGIKKFKIHELEQLLEVYQDMQTLKNY